MDQGEDTNDRKTTKSPNANSKQLKKGKSAVNAKGKRDTAIQGAPFRSPLLIKGQTTAQ